jgi:hypothetical protein
VAAGISAVLPVADAIRQKALIDNHRKKLFQILMLFIAEAGCTFSKAHTWLSHCFYAGK